MQNEVIHKVNYRKGFHRLYILFAFAWMATVLLLLRPDKASFWMEAQPNDWQTIVTAQKIEKPIPTFEEFKAALREANSKPPIVVDPSQVQPIPPGPELRIVASEPLSTPHFYIGKATWLLGVTILPPLFFYLLLFIAVPWVYRGFSTQ